MSRDPLEEQEYENTDPGSSSAPAPEPCTHPFRARTEQGGCLICRMTGLPPKESFTAFHNRVLAFHAGAPYVDVSEPMSMHKTISPAKSGLRILGYLVGILALPHNIPLVSAFAILVISEVLGVVEENHEND